MTISVKNYFESIIKSLNEIERYQKGDISTVTTPSQVSKENPHRPFLDSIRNDLCHFDDEKKARVIFNVGNYLEKLSNDEDQELITVLKRVQEVVEHYKDHQEILVSPEKPKELSPERVTESQLESVRRSLFKFDTPTNK